MTIKNTVGILTALILLVAVVVMTTAWVIKPFMAIGSVQQGGEYQSTTTPAVADLAVISSTQGTLGSVIITSASVGNFQLYDATTSDITKRAPSKATTTLLLVDFSQTVVGNATSTGTHTFDVNFYDGLLIKRTATVSTSTITWRPR